jgi:hypothetical protein
MLRQKQSLFWETYSIETIYVPTQAIYFPAVADRTISREFLLGVRRELFFRTSAVHTRPTKPRRSRSSRYFLDVGNFICPLALAHILLDRQARLGYTKEV